MSAIKSALDPHGADYQSRREAMLAKLAELDQEHAKALRGGGEKYVEALRGGGEKYVERHRKRGKLLARERIELLLDPDSPFLELSPLAAWGTEFRVVACVITGIGVVEGVECM
ncbi:MAG: acetyl/propionyl CoA carboxylase, beta subunit, partial [Actinomycetia bacterium]|nr:acetyl/propionyl CoA carboxylase, beta subunit [Actinomycetes bacterium]